MDLTSGDRELAIATLNACGIVGDDAMTSLDTLCRLAHAPSLEAWRAQHQATAPAALYGSDATRAARVLQVHLPAPSDAPS